MPMYININPYLNHLKAIESIKPEGERRPVPTLTEIAKLAEVHQTTVSRIAGNKVSELNLKVCDVTITELRRRGFDTDVNDIIKYIPDGTQAKT